MMHLIFVFIFVTLRAAPKQGSLMDDLDKMRLFKQNTASRPRTGAQRRQAMTQRRTIP
jgi:hypothetical protein